MTGEPGLLSRLFNFPVGVAFSIGLAMLSFVALYQIGAILKFKPLRIRSFEIAYPRYAVVASTAHAHNSLLQWTSEMGLPGALLLIPRRLISPSDGEAPAA